MKIKKELVSSLIVLFLLITGGNSSGGAEPEQQNTEPVPVEDSAGYYRDKKTADNTESVAIEDIVITGEEEDRHELSEIPVSLSIIDELELRRNVTTTVGDLLRDVPGIEILDTGVLAGQKRIMIRGESGSRVLLLVDGQKISEQKSMDGAALLMDMNAIERIEITKGPATVLHGSEGLGGVINVITKKAGERTFQLETSNAFNTNTDGWNNYISVYGGGEDMHGFGYRLSVANTDHGNQHGQNREVMERTNFHNSERSAYLDYTFKDIKIGASFFDYTSDTNAYAFKTEPYDFSNPPEDWNVPIHRPADYYEPYMEFRQMALPEWNRKKTALFAEWNNISSTLFKIRIDAYEQDTFKHFVVEPFVGVGGWYPDHTDWMESVLWDGGFPQEWPNKFEFINFEMHTKNEMHTENVTVKTDWMFFDSHYLVLGAAFHVDDLGAVMTQQYSSGSIVTVMNHGKKYEWVEADRKKGDIFIQNEWSIAEDWLATFGFRYSEVKSRLISYRELHLNKVDQVLLEYAIDSGNERADDIRKAGNRHKINIANPESTTDYATNYSISLVNNSFDNLTLRIHHGTAHTLPSLNSLFIWSSQSGITVAPNPNLRPEKASSFEIGARYGTANWDIDLTVYRSFTEDYLTIVDLPASYVSGAGRIRMNLHSAETRGLELGASYTFQPWQLTPYVVGYYIKRTFQYREMTIGEGTNARTWGENFQTSDTGLPLIQGRFGIRYEHAFDDDKRFWLDIYGRAAKSALELSPRRIVATGKRVIVTDVPGWETANFACGLELPLFTEYSSVDLNFAVNNIFDRRYKTAHQKIMDSPGRHFTFKINTRF